MVINVVKQDGCVKCCYLIVYQMVDIISETCCVKYSYLIVYQMVQYCLIVKLSCNSCNLLNRDDEQDRKERPPHVAESHSIRHNLMQMLGLASPDTANTATQTHRIRRTASTQTEPRHVAPHSQADSSSVLHQVPRLWNITFLGVHLKEHLKTFPTSF